MIAKISNGIGSDVVVLSNKNEIQSGALVLFPASDKLAMELSKAYCERLPDDDKDKSTLRQWLRQFEIEWAKADRTMKWETPE